MLGTETILFLALGALAGGFINGLAGFGTSLFALGFWLQVLPPVQAVAVSLVVSVVTGLPGCWAIRDHIAPNLTRLLRFVIPAVFAIPIGIYTLAFVDPRVLKTLIAVFLIFYGGFFILRRSLPSFEKPMKSIDALIGGLGGFLGGLAGLSGALPAMWVALRPWKRQTTRAVLQPFNIIVLGASAAILAFQGVYSGDILIALAVVLPIALIGSQVGLVVFKRISDTRFRWLLIALMLCSGLVLLIRTVF